VVSGSLAVPAAALALVADWSGLIASAWFGLV
jgi:hypothetical protein